MSDDRHNLEAFAEMAVPGMARENAYHLALGRFVSTYAGVEAAMQVILRHYTRTSLGIGRAVFSGARTDVIRGYLKRLFDVGAIPIDQWKDLAYVLEQLRIISDRRNTILHYGALGIAEGRGKVTNALMALTEERITTFPISEVILEQMRYDCMKIVTHLVYRHAGISASAENSAMIERTMRAAWRYIPPPQARNP